MHGLYFFGCMTPNVILKLDVRWLVFLKQFSFISTYKRFVQHYKENKSGSSCNGKILLHLLVVWEFVTKVHCYIHSAFFPFKTDVTETAAAEKRSAEEETAEDESPTKKVKKAEEEEESEKAEEENEESA